MAVIISTNPARNYEKLGQVKVTSDSEITKKVKDARIAAYAWKRLGIDKRVLLMRHVADIFKAHADQIAQLITQEVGTPITECREEVLWNWEYIEWFLDNANTYLSDEVIHAGNNVRYKIRYEPLGTAAVITPWNLPFDMFIWGIFPNLIAGNTVIYKASAECALTGKLIDEIMSTTGLPKGVFSAIHGTGKQGEKLANEQGVDFIWFTGSTYVGKKLYEKAGRKFIKTIVELGGSNPAIIFKDADLDLATDAIVGSRFAFCAQTCDAVKRVIVHKDVYEKVLLLLEKKIRQLRIGDPGDPATQIGSLVSKKQYNTLIFQVKDALDKGAHIITGGKQPDNLKGAYYLPTLLTNINRNMKVWNEEVFGPVLPIATFYTEEEAINMANDTEYGLGSMVFTKNKSRQERIVGEIKAGSVNFNGISHFKPFNPFGGYKASGMGREHGAAGFRELVQIKLISEAV